MIFLGVLFVLVLVGIALLASPASSWTQARSLLRGISLFLVMFCFLWISTLLLPPGANWVVIAVGAFVLVFAVILWEGRARRGSTFFSLAVSVLVFHVTLVLFDLAASTRPFASDGDLLLAAAERATSLESIGQTGVVASFVAAGAFAGQLIGTRSLRKRQL